jgi:anti-sigma B factor antagonist
MSTSRRPTESNGVRPGSVLRRIEAGDFVVLGLEGEFDMYLTQQIDEHAREALAAHRNVIFDLSDATFIDSAILRAMLQVHRAASEQGLACVMQLDKASIVERVIEIAGLERQIPLARNRADAISMLRPIHDATPKTAP